MREVQVHLLDGRPVEVQPAVRLKDVTSVKQTVSDCMNSVFVQTGMEAEPAPSDDSQKFPLKACCRSTRRDKTCRIPGDTLPTRCLPAYAHRQRKAKNPVVQLSFHEHMVACGRGEQLTPLG